MKKILLIGICLVLVMPTFIWARHYGRSLCHTQGYTCFSVGRGDTWASLWPDADKRYLIMRVNRMNTPLYQGIVLAVPDGMEYAKAAPFPSNIEPLTRNTIIVDLQVQAFGAYTRSGDLVHWGAISGGKGWCPDINAECSSPRGRFYVYSRGGAECKSTKFPVPTGGAPMPFCMFFYKGFALHGGYLPGYNDSHGCIRMFPEDAEWLNMNFIEFGRFGTQVIVR